MDSFEVSAKDTEVLDASHIVQELQGDSEDMDLFPALIDGQIGYFHEIDGGFDRSEGHHIVNLIHKVQGIDSPPNKTDAPTVELHLDTWFYNLHVEDSLVMGDYPDEDFVLSLVVTDYQMGKYSFSDAMRTDIDKRHQEFGPNV